MNDLTSQQRMPLAMRQWIMFLLACGTSFILYLHRYTWNFIGPELKKEYGLNDTQVGTLAGMFNWTYGPLQIPSGVVADFFGPHMFLGCIIALWSVVLLLHGSTGNLFALGGVRMAFGVAQAGTYPSLTKVTHSWVPRRFRTISQAMVASLSGRGGGALSPIIFGTVLMGWYGLSWRAALIILSMIGIVFAILFALVFRNSPEVDVDTGRPRVPAGSGETFKIRLGNNDPHKPGEPADSMIPSAKAMAIEEALKDAGMKIRLTNSAADEYTLFVTGPLPGDELLKKAADTVASRLQVRVEVIEDHTAILIPAAHEGENRKTLRWGNALKSRSMWFFIVQQFNSAGADALYSLFLGGFFLEALRLPIEESGYYIALPLLGGALGGFLGGFLNDLTIWLTGSYRWGRSLIGFTGKVVAAIWMLIAIQQADPAYAAGSLFCAKFFTDWSQPTVWGTCTDMGGRFSATVFGIINSAGAVGGILCPPLFGFVLDRYAHTVSIDGAAITIPGYEQLFYVVGLMYVLSAVCWLGVDCTKSLDQDPPKRDIADLSPN